MKPSLVELALARRTAEQHDAETRKHPPKPRIEVRRGSAPHKRCRVCGSPCNTSPRKRYPDLCMACGQRKREVSP